MRRVAIIIVNYREREDTLECLGSVSHLTYPNFCVYLVDQASKDGTPSALRAAFPDVQVIENPTNNGFAGGNNDAIRRARFAGPSDRSRRSGPDDWCARVKASGCRLRAVPTARLWHKVERSLGTAPDRTLYYMRRNVFLFLEQNARRRGAIWAARWDALYLIVVLWVKGKQQQGRVVWRAVADYHRRRFGAAEC